MSLDEEEDDDEAMITSKLQLVLAAKSRKLQYISSPITSHHMSLSFSSSPDDSISRASVPFSWEEEPGKPKYYRLRHHSVSKNLVLPPRLLLPDDITKTPLTVNHHHRLRLTGFKRWFWWRKERAGDGYVARKSRFFFQYEDEDDMKRRTRDLHCLSSVTSCYF